MLDHYLRSSSSLRDPPFVQFHAPITVPEMPLCVFVACNDQILSAYYVNGKLIYWISVSAKICNPE